MIDTVRMLAPHALLEDHPVGWTRTLCANRVGEGNGDTEVVWWSLMHGDTGLTLTGHGHKMQYIRVSLPRLLHGTNCCLIKSAAELKQALRMTRDLVETIAEPLGDPNERFTRVDLVWQFRLNPSDVMNAHRSCKHRSIRRVAGHYDGQSVYWKGSEMQVRIYDKCQQAYKRPGDVVRVEIQLTKRKLARELGDGRGDVRRLNFKGCYRAYRSLLLGFEPEALPTNGLSIAHILALADRDDWRPLGENLFDSYTRDMSARNIRRVRREVAAARPSVFQFSWRELLPADRLPPVVEPDMPVNPL